MAKTRTDGGVDAPRRKRLEALREDCRRHDQCAVLIAFVQVERASIPEAARLSRMPFPERWCCRVLDNGEIEMALWGGEDKAEKNAVAYLARLGRELAEMGVPSSRYFPDLEYLAMFELASRAPSTKSWVPPTMPPTMPPMPEIAVCRAGEEGDMKRRIEEGWKAAGFIEKTERKVPDVRAAIAELCDELLEIKPSAAAPKQEKRTDDQKFAEASAILLQEFERSGRMLNQKQVAARIKMREEDLSRLVGKSGDKGKEWLRLKQTLVSRRPGRATPSGDDEGE
jgi:hypothetical protein